MCVSVLGHQTKQEFHQFYTNMDQIHQFEVSLTLVLPAKPPLLQQTGRVSCARDP
jgi:hypothetical protein